MQEYQLLLQGDQAENSPYDFIHSIVCTIQKELQRSGFMHFQNNKHTTKTICDYNRSWVITNSSHNLFVIALFSIEFLLLPLKFCHKPTLQFLIFGNKREIQMLPWDWECFQSSTCQTAVCRRGNQMFHFVPILNTLWKAQTRYQSALNHAMKVLLCVWTQGGVDRWSAST